MRKKYNMHISIWWNYALDSKYNGFLLTKKQENFCIPPILQFSDFTQLFIGSNTEEYLRIITAITAKWNEHMWCVCRVVACRNNSCFSYLFVVKIPRGRLKRLLKKRRKFSKAARSGFIFILHRNITKMCFLKKVLLKVQL